MAVARVDNPWVRNLTLAPSRVYAVSPYRPYAGVFTNKTNISSQQYQDNFVRALSPFSINDKNVIEAIRRSNNIIDNGNYRTASNIGFGVGAVAGVVASGVLYGTTITTLSNALIYGGILSVNPIGWGIAAVGTALAVAGTIMTSAELGRAIGASIGSKEGSIAMGRYLANLGNSMVKRPTSTALTVATIFATNWALNKTPIKSPIVRQGATMVAMRVVRPIADKIDDSLFGELSEVDQMSYTDLLALQGDLADNFSGTSIVKSALAGIKGGEEKSKELIAKMYGRHEEGFDPLDFSDVRETWGVDIGTFGNGVIDILGEIVFDTDNSVNTIKNKTNTTISTSIKMKMIKKILSDENSDLFKRYFERVSEKQEDGTTKEVVKAKEAFKNEFQNKAIQRVIERYLDDYRDPSLAKTKEQRDAIIANNNKKLDHYLGDLYSYLYRKGLANLKQDADKMAEAKRITDLIKKEIEEGLNSHAGYLNTRDKNKADYAQAVKKMVDAQKEATKIVNQNIKNNTYNFDKAMLKEFDIHKAEFDDNYITGLLKLHPAFYLYSEANNKNMRVLGFFTRPFQSIVTTKTARKVIVNTLNKIQRKWDPFKKITKVEEIMREGNAITKEQQEKAEEELKLHNEALKEELKRFEQEKMKEILGEEEINKIIDELNKVEEEFETHKLTPLEEQKYKELEARRKAVLKKYQDAKKASIEKMKKEDQRAYNRMEKTLKKLNETYKEMKLSSEFVDKYIEMTKFEYIKNGKKEIVQVTSENEKDVLNFIKELEAKKDLSGEERVALENAKLAYFLFAKENIFKDGYKKIISKYNQVIQMMQNFETWFTENFYNLESLVLNSVIFADVKALQKEIKELDEKISKTQDEADILNREKILTRYRGKIKEIVLSLNNKNVFDPETRKQIIKALEGDEFVQLPIYYATNFFAGIKLFEEDKSFFLNNRALFDKINEMVMKPEIQAILEDLRGSIERDVNSKTKFKFVNRTDFIENKKRLTEEVKKILLKLNTMEDPDNPGSKLLNDTSYEIVKEKINGTVLSLINTHKSMETDVVTGRKNNMYSKRFSEMSTNDMLDYAYRMAIKNNPSLSGDSKDIDNILKDLDYSMKQLLKALKDANNGKLNVLEGLVHEQLRRQMYKINASKIINAISAKYLRVGQSKQYYAMEELEPKKIKALDKGKIDKISKKKYMIDSASKEEVKEKLAEQLLESFKGTEVYPILLKMGLGKLIEENFEVKEEKQTEEKSENKELDFSNRGIMYSRLVSSITSKIEFETKAVLSEKDKKEISRAVAKAIQDQLDSIKSEYETKFFESGATKKTFDDFFMKKLNESFFGKLIDVENLSSILRGEVNLPKTRIDMTKPDKELGIKGNPYRNAIIHFMLNNEPTLENIMKLKLQPFGTYLNYNGKPVTLENISQLGEENLVGAWAEKFHSTFEKTEDPMIYEFFRGIDLGKKKNAAMQRYIENTYDLPNRLKNEDQLKDLKDSDFKEVKDENDDEGSLAHEIIRLFKESRFGVNFKKYSVSKKSYLVMDKSKKDAFINDIVVLRVKTIGNKTYDFYLPKENKIKVGMEEIISYKINGNEYMRIKIEDEDDKSLNYLENILSALEKDFITRKSISDEFNQKFEPLSIQKEIFRLFSKQRSIGEDGELITDFVYVDPKKTDFEKLVFHHMRRLNEGQRKNILKDENFREEYKKKGYFFDYTQSDPKVVIKGIQLSTVDYASVTKVFAPLASFTGRAERSALSINARRQAQKLDTLELPFLRSKYMEGNKGLEEFEKGGVNARVYLTHKDIYDEKTGHSTHNETILVRESFAKEKFKRDGKPLTLSNGMKLIDRNSSKHGIRIVSDAEWENLFGTDKKALNADVVMSKRTVRKRKLWNVQAELAINKLSINKKGALVDKVKEKFVDSETKDIEEYKKLTEDGNLEGDFGYLYLFLTDDLSDNDGSGFKASGDNDYENGAKISIEEWQMFSALREIEFTQDGIRQPLDPNGKLFEFLWNRTKTPEGDLREAIFGNINGTTGKQGKFRKEIIERVMPNSAYAKAISNISLKRDEIAIPQAMADKMGLVKDEKGDYGYVLLHRSPTQGRRSFVYAKVVISKEDGITTNKAIEVNPYFEDALNLDFDGDGVSIFSLKGATPEVLKLAENAFSHDYSKRKQYGDYRIRKSLNIKDEDIDLKTEEEFDVSRDKTKIFKNEDSDYDKFYRKNKYDPKFVQEEEWDQVMVSQKTLKDYSGLYKNIFDADYQDYISNKENMEWFKTAFKDLEEDGIIIDSFYALTTLAYDFYSQKTFDFSKHSEEGEGDQFKKIYDLIKRVPGETFKYHIRKLIKVLIYDMEQTKIKKQALEEIENRNDLSDLEKRAESKKITEKYLKSLERLFEAVKKVDALNVKSKEQVKKELEIKNSQDTFVKKEEYLKPQFDEADDQLLRDVNKILKKKGIPEMSKEELQDFKSEKMFTMANEFDQNEIKVFKMNDFKLEMGEQKQVFDFIIKMNTQRAVSSKRKAKTERQILNPFYSAITSYLKKVLVSFYDDQDVLRNTKLVKLVEVNGKIVEQEVELLNLFSIFKLNPDGTSEPKKPRGFKDLNPVIVSMDNVTVNRRYVGLEDKRLRGFYFKNTSGHEVPKLERYGNELYQKMHNATIKSLNNLGLGRSPIFNPLVHNKLLFENKIFDGMYKAIINNEEGLSMIVDILRDLGDEESLKELQAIFKPFFMFQNVAEYIEPGKRSNFMKYLYQVEGLFDDRIKTPIPEKSTGELVKSLILKKMMNKGESLRSFGDKIKAILNIDDDKVVDEVIEIYFNLREGLKEKDTFNSLSQFDNMDQEYKLNILTKIYEVKKGLFIQKHGSEYGLTQDDLRNKTEEFEIDSSTMNKFFRIYDYAEETVEGTFDIKNRKNILRKLQMEKNILTVTNNVIKNANYELSKMRASSITIQNTEGSSEDVDVYPFRSLLHPNNIEENTVVLMNANSNKIAKDFTQRFYRTTMQDYDKDAADSDMTIAINKLSNDYKASNDIMSIYLYEGKSVEGFIDTLEKLIDNQLDYTIPLTDRIFKFFLHFNKMSKAMGFDKKIMPGTIDAYYRDIKASNIVDFEGNIKMNNIYRIMFFDYVQGEGMQVDPRNNTPAFQKAFNDLSDYFSKNPTMKTFGLHPHIFVETFFGKMLFEQRTQTKQFLEGKTAKEAHEDVVKSGLKRIEEMETLSKNRDLTSNEFLKSLEESYEKGETLNIEQITVDPVKQKEIIDAFKKFQSQEYLEEKIVNDRVSNVFDTFEWASFVGQNDVTFNMKNLFNIYAQLTGRKTFSEEEIKVMTEEMANEIVKNNKNKDFKFKGNKRIHTALIDAQINLKVMEMIVKEYDKNISRYEDFPEMKILIEGFRDETTRKNFAIIDTENLVSANDYNRIYEISYITFDDKGEPLYHQHYLKYDLDDRTVRWLKDMGYSESEIGVIKNNMVKIADPDYNKKIYEQVFKDLKGKNIIGQSVKSTNEKDGDIGKLNEEYRRILRNDVRKVIKKHNESEQKFLDNIKTFSMKDLMKNVDKTKPNSPEQMDMMLKLVTDILKKDLDEKILPQGIEKIDNEQFNTHISKTSALMEVFVKETNKDIVKLRMEEILEIDKLPDELFEKIYKKFEDKFQDLKGHNNNDGVLLMKFPRLVETESGIRVEFQEIDEKSIMGNDEEFLIKKIKYDPNDIRANFLFRSRAFYEIIREVKDMIIVRGIPYEHLGKTVQRTMTLNEYEALNRKVIRMQSKITDNDLKVGLHLERARQFMFQGNMVEYLVEMNKAIKEYEKIHATKDEFGNIDLNTDVDRVDAFLKEQTEKNTGRMANIPMWKVEKYFADMISNFYKETLAAKRKPEAKVVDTKFITKMEDIITALEYENIAFMPVERMAQILGIQDLEFADKILNQFQEIFVDYKRNGIPFYYAGSDTPYSIMPYREDAENLFKKMAFYAVLNPKSQDKKTLANFLRNIIKEEGVREYKRYDIDEQKQDKIDQIKSRLVNKKVEDERNKQKFIDERIKVKNLILNEKWDELEAYLKDKPGEAFDLVEFRKNFEQRFNDTKRTGIAKYKMEWRLEGTTPTPFEKVIEKVPYIEQPFVRGEFLRTTLSEFEDQISEMVYIKGYYTSNSDEILNKNLSYKWYNDHLEDYRGKWVPSDYRRDHPQNASIKQSYEYLGANVNKVRDLSQYQAGFAGMIHPFRLSNGDYDWDRLYYEITEGYLSKIYKITIISNVSKQSIEAHKKSEYEEIEDSTARRNKEFKKNLDKKIEKLENKIKELEKLGTDEANKRIAQLRLQIEDTKKATYYKNKYYDEVEISKIRRAEPIWKSDEEIFDDPMLDWMNNIKDTAHPTLKVIAISGNKAEGIKQLQELVRLNNQNGGLFLGFTLLHDILKTDEMSYSGYTLPKPVALLQSSIIKFQKFMMLMNSGFMVRNIYDGMLRNHQLILGSDDIVSENFRFAKEAFRTWNLMFKYKAYAKAHGFQVRELKHLFENVKAFEEGDYDISTLKSSVQDFQVLLRGQIDSIDAYLKNIISDEAQTSNRYASQNYNELNRVLRRLRATYTLLSDTEIKKDKAFVKMFSSELRDYLGTYQESGFFKQVVMNSNVVLKGITGSDRTPIKLDFTDGSKENIRKVKDELALIKLINEIEKSGIVSDQYEITGKQDIKEIYRNIDKMLDDELMKVGLNDRIDKILSHHPIAIATSYIEQHQRIHGVMLDMFMNGKTKDRALAESLGRFFNYGMKGAFEKSASVYFPFMSFAIRNLDYYLELMGDQKYMRFMTNVAQGMNTWYDDEEDENFRFSNSFNDFTEQQGWIPLGKNYGIKMGNAMFDAMSLIEDPFQSGYQKLNPVLQQANNLTKGEDFNPKALASVTQYNRMASALGTIAKGQGMNMPQDLPDLVPSLFYKRSQYTPYQYRRYSTDYRNIYRNLFFSDGSRRVPSKNPFTTAKNIRYETFVRARMNANIR